tara:strand:- start:903 stop:1121 length:219 start_codon:yes stop_codon:yes gene_type:complete
MTKLYEVKLIVEEEHYLEIEANSVDEASELAEEYGVCSIDAHSTTVDTASVLDKEKGIIHDFYDGTTRKVEE